MFIAFGICKQYDEIQGIRNKVLFKKYIELSVAFALNIDVSAD